MRKVFYLFAALIACALTMNSCVPKPDPTPVDENAVELTQVVAGVSDFYNTWEETREMPTSFTVGGKNYTLAQFVMLEAGAIANIAGGKTDKVSPKEYNAPSNPERDSYDKEEIAVTNGPADGKGNPEEWVAVVKPGRIMFEIDGVSEDVAREALRLAQHKLPIRTKIVSRADQAGEE